MAIATGGYYFAIDCPDTLALAIFYSKVIGLPIVDGSHDRWASIRGPEGKVAFQLAEDYQPPTWPGGEHPQQMHMDVIVRDLDAAEAAVIELGATKHDEQPGDDWRVFLDPAGHPFCLCQQYD